MRPGRLTDDWERRTDTTMQTRNSIRTAALLLLAVLVFVHCAGKPGEQPSEQLSDKPSDKLLAFYKVNIVSPNPEHTFDSLREHHNLPVFWEFEEGAGYASGGLLLANAVLDIKTYFDSTQTSAEPMELVLTTQLADSIAYKTLVKKGISANPPFRRDGWFWSVITLPDLNIMGNQSNGVYITRYDDASLHARELDSLQAGTRKRLESIVVYSPDAEELKSNWNKLNLEDSGPAVRFVLREERKVEIVIE